MLCGLLACLGVLLAAGSASGVRSASAAGASSPAGQAARAMGVAKSVTFFDATAEDPKGPDITAVVVSNSDAVWQHEGLPLPRPSSVITFRIDAPNRPRLTKDMRVAVWVDADDDRATGLAGDVVPVPGADYLINWDRKLREEASLLRCNGSMCGTAPAPTLGFSYESGATFTILASDLGETRRFRFSVRATSGIVYTPDGGLDFTNAGIDFAPEEGSSWSYSLLLRPKRLLVDAFSTVPTAPRAGATLTVRLTARRDDTGALVSGGRVICTAAIGEVRVRPRLQRFVGRQATCVFALPADAGGKAIRGWITVVFQGAKATKTFSRRIR